MIRSQEIQQPVLRMYGFLSILITSINRLGAITSLPPSLSFTSSFPAKRGRGFTWQITFSLFLFIGFFVSAQYRCVYEKFARVIWERFLLTLRGVSSPSFPRLTFYAGFMIAHLLLSVIKSSFNRALIKVSLNFDIKVASVTNVGLVQVNGAIRNLTSSPTRHRPANNLFLLSLTCNFETPLRF